MGNLVIIGGGVAGLSTGIYAQMRGYNAIIVEKHNILGGNLTGWDRSGYHIDNCVHWLAGTNKNDYMYKMWEDLGALGNVAVHQGDAFYTYEKDGKRLSANKDLRRFEKDLLDISPEDEKEIKSLIKGIRAVQGIYGIAGENHDEKFNLFKTVAHVPSIIKYYNITIGQLTKKFNNQLIRDFLTCLFTERFSALILVFFFALFSGGDAAVPSGGSLAMAGRMAERFVSLGGKVILGSEVTKINVAKNRAYSVNMKDGQIIDADAVVIAVDPQTVFGSMLDMPMPSQLKRMYEDKKLAKFSSFQCAFACEKKHIPFKGEIIFDLTDGEIEALNAKTMLLREYSHESGFAPEGETVLQSMVFFREDVCDKFIESRKNDRKAYVESKKSLAKVVKSAIERQYISLKNKLKLLDVWTPASYKRYTASASGTYMSFAFSSKVIPARKSNRIKGLKNVVLATQWIQALGGLPVAAECGKIAVKTLERIRAIKKSLSAIRLKPSTEIN